MEGKEQEKIEDGPGVNKPLSTLLLRSSNPDPGTRLQHLTERSSDGTLNGRPKCWIVVETDPKPKGTLDVRAYNGNPVPYHPSVSARDQNKTVAHPSGLPLS